MGNPPRDRDIEPRDILQQPIEPIAVGSPDAIRVIQQGARPGVGKGREVIKTWRRLVTVRNHHDSDVVLGYICLDRLTGHYIKRREFDIRLDDQELDRGIAADIERRRQRQYTQSGRLGRTGGPVENLRAQRLLLQFETAIQIAANLLYDRKIHRRPRVGHIGQ